MALRGIDGANYAAEHPWRAGQELRETLERNGVNVSVTVWPHNAPEGKKVTIRPLSEDDADWLAAKRHVVEALVPEGYALVMPGVDIAES